jgi:hypothetical protein
MDPEFLKLNSPTTAEYSDTIDLTAKIENLYHQPLSGISVSFFHSSDNLSWIFLTEEVSDENGYAIGHYTINQGSGVEYFKAEVSFHTAYSSTTQLKENIQVVVPRVYSIYGSAIGYADITEYILEAQIIDDDGQPIESQLALFYLQGIVDPIFTATNDSGYASSPVGLIDWNAGYYPNSFWILINMDENLYNYPAITYGDLDISPNTLTIQSPALIEQFWNEPFSTTIRFFDLDNDPVPNLSFEVIIFENRTNINTSLGILQTDVNGYGYLSFPAEFFDPGDFVIYIKVNSFNYLYFEESIPMKINSDKAVISTNLSENETYVYNSLLFVETWVTDHLGNPIDNMTVLIYVSVPNEFGIWDETFYIITNSSGYASVELSLDMNANDVLCILITTIDYYESGILYYTKSDSITSYVTCLKAPSGFHQLSDIDCVNQETITIDGYLLSNSFPVDGEVVTITILGTEYQVITDSNGYFALIYTVEQGGIIAVQIDFDSSQNYFESSVTIYLNSTPCSLILDSNDNHQNTSNPIDFIVYVESAYGTTPEGIELKFYWFDSNSWIYIGSAFTNSSGYAVLTPSVTFPMGEWIWKASIESDSNWCEVEIIRNLKVGISTTISLAAPATAGYQTSITLEAEVRDEYNQPIQVEVAFYLNETLIGSGFSNAFGIVSFEWFVDLIPGIYNLKAEIIQSGMYIQNSTESVLQITKTASFISSNDVFIYYNQSAFIYIYLYSSLGGIPLEYVTITISGILQEQVLTNSSGWIEWEIPSISPGIYEIDISFAGNNYYLNSILQISLQIDKMPTNLTLNAPNQTYSTSYLISGHIQDVFFQPIEGLILKLIINGTEYQITSSDEFGYYEFIVSLEPATYLIEVEFIGDSYFLASNALKTVYIWKIETTIEGQVSWNEMSLIIETNLEDITDNPLANEAIYFYLNGSLIGENTTDSNGYAIFILEGQTPGIYEIEIVFLGTSIYSESSQMIVLEQTKLQTELSVHIFEGIYATQETVIEIRLTSEGVPLENKNIQITINSIDYYALTNSSGYAVLVLNLYMNAGLCNLYVYFEGDILYSAIMFNSNFNISKAESSINLTFYYENYQPWLLGSLIGDVALSGETIVLDQNGVYYKTLITDQNGEFLTFIDLPIGTYEIIASFYGNENYLPTSKLIMITIYKTTTEIVFTGSFNQSFGQTVTLDVQLVDSLDNPIIGQLIVSLDGNHYATLLTNETGFATLILSDLISVGSHVLRIEFQGNAMFYQTSLDIPFHTKYEINLVDLQINPQSYGTEGSISGIIDSYLGLLDSVSIVLVLDGFEYLTLTDSDGNFYFSIDQFLDAGTYQVMIKVDENDIMLYFETTFELNRSKGSANISLNTLQKVFNQNTNFYGTVSFLSIPIPNVTINVYVDSVLLGSLITNTQGEFIIPSSWLEMSPKNYILTIEVISNDANIEDTSKDFLITILKDNPTIEFDFDNNIVEEEVRMIIRIYDSNHIPLPFMLFTATIGDDILTGITDEEGIAYLDYYVSNTDTLEIIINIAETSHFNTIQSLNSINIEKCDSQFSIDNTQTSYNSSSGLEIKLQSINGNSLEGEPVLIFIGINSYTYYSDSYGVVSLDLSEYEVGIYQMDIFFGGSDNYNPTTLSVEFEITPQATYLKIEQDKQNLILQLVDGENRSLSDKEIKISYISLNGTTVKEERFVTNPEGFVILQLDTKFLPKDAKELLFVYGGERSYIGCEIKIDLQKLIDAGKNFLSSTTFLWSMVSVIGILVIISLRRLLKRRKLGYQI